MNIRLRNQIIKEMLLILLLTLIVRETFWIGYKLTGDAHSGGPLFGIPIVILSSWIMTKIAFYRDSQVNVNLVFVRDFALSTLAAVVSTV